jgi:hypothetical protein
MSYRIAFPWVLWYDTTATTTNQPTPLTNESHISYSGRNHPWKQSGN